MNCNAGSKCSRSGRGRVVKYIYISNMHGMVSIAAVMKRIFLLYLDGAWLAALLQYILIHIMYGTC